ncbi:TMEM43 family protein, partial [Escherichia coli]|uniref:TMEM43 family protein n=1 Tax=Escherichia coli TaxID=562 RepID=UPI001954CA65
FAARFGNRTRLSDGSVYVGDDPANPRIGDIRISYSILPEGAVSVVGRQIGNGLTAYVAGNGREVFLGETGTKSSAEMFTHAREANST